MSGSRTGTAAEGEREPPDRPIAASGALPRRPNAATYAGIDVRPGRPPPSHTSSTWLRSDVTVPRHPPVGAPTVDADSIDSRRLRPMDRSEARRRLLKRRRRGLDGMQQGSIPGEPRKRDAVHSGHASAADWRIRALSMNFMATAMLAPPRSSVVRRTRMQVVRAHPRLPASDRQVAPRQPITAFSGKEIRSRHVAFTQQIWARGPQLCVAEVPQEGSIGSLMKQIDTRLADPM